MSPAYSTLPFWSYSLACIAYLMYAVRLIGRYLTMARSPSRLAFLSAVALTSLWAANGFFTAMDERHAYLLPVHSLLDSLRYGAWYALFSLLLYSASRDRKFAWPVTVGLIIFLGNLSLLTALTLVDSPAESLIRASQYALLAQTIYALVLIEQLFRNTIEDSLWKIKPLGIGLGAAFIFDLYLHSTTLLFNHVDHDVFAVRGLAHTLVLPLIALTLYRTRKRGLSITVSKAVAFHTTTLAAAGAYLLVASAAGYYARYLGGSWGNAMRLAILFAALLLLVLFMFSGTMRSRIKVLVGKHFFTYRYDYREEWLKFTRALSSEADAREVGEQVIRGLARLVESPAGSLWLRDPEGRFLVQTARWNQPESDAREPVDGSLLRFMNDSNWVVNLAEYRRRPGHYQNLVLPDWLKDLPRAWLVVPLVTSSGMAGMVVLSTSRTHVDVNWEVNDLLRTAGKQAAAFLTQLQATEALLEARKFDAFNRMSAFVVHDLKNIVTQLSLMVKNAERHADNPEFQRDMVLTVGHAVDRMKQLMLQLREGATPPDGSRAVGLDVLVRRIRDAKATQMPAVQLRTVEPILARGHEERLERVIGHLVQNAIDATPPEGQVWIAVRREDNMALVEVGDTGRGMSAEFIRDRLFKPFQSTKQAGMGIGAYESRQYIQELGGDIRVESKENDGTRFLVRLPLIEAGLSSGLKQLEIS